jgi:nicotinamidase-related amidase
MLIHSEYGHPIIPEFYPLSTKPVIDKSGKDAFYEIDLALILANRGIKSLIVCGVTPEVCVHPTGREAIDCGYGCLVPEDYVGSYFPEFQWIGLAIIKTRRYFRLGIERKPSG